MTANNFVPRSALLNRDPKIVALLQKAKQLRAGAEPSAELKQLQELHRLVSLADVCKWAGISIPTLRKMIRLGTGPKITQMGRQLKVRVSHYLEWLDTLQQ